MGAKDNGKAINSCATEQANESWEQDTIRGPRCPSLSLMKRNSLDWGSYSNAVMPTGLKEAFASPIIIILMVSIIQRRLSREFHAQNSSLPTLSQKREEGKKLRSLTQVHKNPNQVIYRNSRLVCQVQESVPLFHTNDAEITFSHVGHILCHQ